MQSTTAAVALAASRDRVFEYLSRIESLPERATEFVEEFEVRGASKAWARTPMGEVEVRLDPDERTGVVDIYVDQGSGPPALFPARVIPLNDGTCAFLFTMFRNADQTPEAFDQQLRSLERELENLTERFGGREDGSNDG